LTNFPVTIGGTTYANYACAGVCCSGTDFFGSHAWIASSAPNPSPLRDFFNIYLNGGAAPADFNTRISFVHPETATPASPNRDACIQWINSPAKKLRFNKFVSGSCTTTALSSVAGDTPALIYQDLGAGQVNLGGITYEGAAVILARGSVSIS